ncbi:MAG: peptidylprolyl isomerase [Thermoguttaceae bacterium]
MPVRIVLTLIFALLIAPAWAADATAKRGPRAEEFYSLHAEMNGLLGELANLQLKYKKANEEQRTAIQAKWKELIAKGEKLQPKLIDAAEKAYDEAPNADKDVSDFLVKLLFQKVQRDDFEPAYEIGSLLMKHKHPELIVANLAGVAAFTTSHFDAADEYFGLAKKKGYYENPDKRDASAGLGDHYAKLTPQYKQLWAKEQELRRAEAKANDLPRILLKTTKGDIELELFENEAPNTVANFVDLVQRGFYNDVTFHRVLPGFMAQGGDPKGNGSGGPGYTIADECHRANFRRHFRGTLSMAKTAQPDTGGSQFFLTFVPTTHLDGVHTVFGRVVSGMDVLAKLQRREPGDPDAPRADKIIEAKVLRKRPHEYKPVKMPE